MTIDVNVGRSVSLDPVIAVAQFGEQLNQDALDAVVFFCSADYDLDALGRKIVQECVQKCGRLFIMPSAYWLPIKRRVVALPRSASCVAIMAAGAATPPNKMAAPSQRHSWRLGQLIVESCGAISRRAPSTSSTPMPDPA